MNIYISYFERRSKYIRKRAFDRHVPVSPSMTVIHGRNRSFRVDGLRVGFFGADASERSQ